MKKTRRKQKTKKIQIAVRTKRLGSNKIDCQMVTATLDENEVAHLEIEMSVRQTDIIEVFPVRRDISDVDGVIIDALRLAND